LTAATGDVVGSFTGYDDYRIVNAITAQAGASAPEDFLANVIAWGVQSTKVTWGASAGALTYRVFRDDVDVSDELRNVSEFIDSPVVAGTYEYVVKAYNDTDNTSSNTIAFVRGTGGFGTVYDVLMAIYRSMFNQQKIEKVGSTYYLNTYDDDNVTLLASCALKTYDDNDIEDLAGSVKPSTRMRSAISSVGQEIVGSTVYDLLSKIFKKSFFTRKNEEISTGVMGEVVYDEDDLTKISQQHLQTFDGDEIPSQAKVYTPQIRMKSSI
jgi:hypothetical protein